MDEITKTKLLGLRNSGKSYGEISKILNISIGTIKSTCFRSNKELRPKQEVTCRYCHAVITQLTKGKPKIFCSQICRNKWWNENIDKVNKQAFYKLECAYCHRLFERYGRPKAKYCSKACYIGGRYYPNERPSQ